MHEAINQNRTTAKAEDQETISQGKERLLACLLQTKKNMCGRLITTRPRSGRITQVALWLATGLAFLAATVDYWAPLFY